MGQAAHREVFIDDVTITHSLNERNEIVVLDYGYTGQLRYYDRIRCYFIVDDQKYIFSLSKLPQQDIHWIIDYVPNGVIYQYPMKCSLCQSPHVISDKTKKDYFEGKHYMYSQGTFGISTKGKLYYNVPLPSGWSYLGRTDDQGILNIPHKLGDLHLQIPLIASLYIYSPVTYRYKCLGTSQVEWCHDMYKLITPDGIYYAKRNPSNQEKFLYHTFGVQPKPPYENSFDKEIDTNEYYIPDKK